MADTTFQHNVDRLLELTKNVIGNSPKHFTTDELLVYNKSSKRVFGKKLDIILIFTYVKIVIITKWNDLTAYSEILN